MRRTYRSKKDTAGTFDHRDVMQNMEDKGSAFDAYYIQNIKQTKRELSCAGASNYLGVASNKVRKRKYVKRIVKDVEPLRQRETMSSSAYLTPDKSIRVNKVLDPFDLLLNSLPACQEATDVATGSPGIEDVPKKYCKKYTRKRLPKIKLNYSSSDTNSTDSDKENSNEQNNVTDIRTHELLIERVPSKSPNNADESILKIINNMSLISYLKRKTSKNSFNTSYKHNRLSFNSPILPKSPLCSTPYREKYRGQSIFKFSPITRKEQEDSPIAIMEEIDNDERNNSIILINKTGNKKTSTENCTILTNAANLSVVKSQSSVDDISINDNKEIIEQNNIETENNSGSVSQIQFSSFQMADAKPFLGFTNIEFKESINKKISLLKCIEDELRMEDIDDINESEEENNGEPEVSISIHSNKCNTSYSNNSMNSQNSDKESLYDTCNSDQSSDLKEPVVAIERMNDSIFLKYYVKMTNAEIENCTENDDFESLANDSEMNDSYEEYNESKSNVVTITDSSTTDDVVSSNDDQNNDDENNDEQNAISFVTTRRRNEVTADSMLSFDNSFVSSSTDCDKTVISNKVNLENTNLDINVNNDVTTKHSKEFDNNDKPNKRTSRSSRFSLQRDESSPENDRFSMVTYRKSSRSTRSETNQFNTSNEETLIENDPVILNEAENTLEFDANNLKENILDRDSLFSQRLSHIGAESKPSIVLQPGKKWERSLSIYRRMTTMSDLEQSILDDACSVKKGRKYRQSVISTMDMQDRDSLYNDTINSRRSTLISKPGRPTIRFVKDPNLSRVSLNASSVHDDFKGFLNEECDDTVIELSKLSIADSEHEVSILDKLHDTERVVTARDYVLRRCNQAEPLLFDECYPESVLKNCRKIGEGVYGEVFLWRARDGRARVMKIVPIAGTVKVNGEEQKDFHEIISEIVIAMELSALRAPISDIERRLDEGEDINALDLHAIQNATDIFNEVLAVRCVHGLYPSRLLDLWELYDECSGSENDSPATLPVNQRYIVLELANAGQDLESYQFASAQQAHALFQQLAYGLAVAEEAFQFEHRDLHWGNVLIAPTEQKQATFILRGRTYHTPRHGVAATIIDYSLSRVSLSLTGELTQAALYNDLAQDEQLFDAVGDYQFEVYRLMRDKLGNDWKNFEPYTNILWLHYTVDKMITALRYKRTNTKIHKHYIEKLKGIKNRILQYGSAVQYVLTDIEI